MTKALGRFHFKVDVPVEMRQPWALESIFQAELPEESRSMLPRA